MKSRPAEGPPLRRLAAAAALLGLLPCTPLGGTGPAGVTVSILSKQIRLVGEGRLAVIGIRLPAGAAVTDLLRGETSSGGEFRVSLREGRAALFRNGILMPGDCSLMVRSPGGEMEVSLPGELRRYPLPAEIQSSRGSLTVIVTEDAARYASDSAAAEYGAMGQRHGEAMKALSMLLYGKALAGLARPVHGTCHFCDLAHCQVYRGRTSAAAAVIPWRPSGASGHFFHARCGGDTVGCGAFGDGPCAGAPVKCAAVDYRGPLCGGDEWTASLGEDELAAMLFDGPASRTAGILGYDRKQMRVAVASGDRTVHYPAEGFRLAVNRSRGWRFIASNNYTVTETTEAGRRVYTFRGRGLGHGVGLCQEGAKTLALLGYSAAEILDHYFPGMQWRGAAVPESPTPYLSWMLFSLEDGSVVSASYPRLAERRIAPGSLFKVIVALYLALHRPDLLDRHRHVCSGAAQENRLPVCWLDRGHGDIAFGEALAMSCNRYFASLHARLDREEFSRGVNALFREMGMRCRCPVPADSRGFAAMLSGTDFRMRISVGDIMILARLLGGDGPSGGGRIDRLLRTIPRRHLASIRDALVRNLAEGTASGAARPFGPELNYRDLLGSEPGETAALRGVMWGKTATVADGPAGDASCGIFMGGFGGTGIVAVLARGNGHLAAQWARRIIAAHTLPGD